jgi:hypothetical protein
MENQLPTPRNLLLLAVVVEGGLGLVALGLGWLLGNPPLETLDGTPAAAVLGAAAGLPMLLLVWASVRLPVWPFADLLEVVDKLLAPLFARCRLVDLAVISALAGLGEEMLFRGVIQPLAATWVDGPSGPWVGLAVAAVLFGLVHPITFGYVVLAGAMGVYLGWLQIATGNLLVPIVAHAVYDLLALAYLVRIRQRGRPAPLDVPADTPADVSADAPATQRETESSE